MTFLRYVWTSVQPRGGCPGALCSCTQGSDHALAHEWHLAAMLRLGMFMANCYPVAPLSQHCPCVHVVPAAACVVCVLQDWDVFYLAAGCCQILGHTNISRHLVPVYGTAGAMSYMITPQFARKAVKAASDPRLNTWVDLVLQVSR